VLRASNLRNNIEQSHIASRTFNHDLSLSLSLSVVTLLVARSFYFVCRA